MPKRHYAKQAPMMDYMAYVPVMKRHKPFWGNLALAGAVLTINGARIALFLTAAALNAKGNLLDPRRYR